MPLHCSGGCVYYSTQGSIPYASPSYSLIMETIAYTLITSFLNCKPKHIVMESCLVHVCVAG